MKIQTWRPALLVMLLASCSGGDKPSSPTSPSPDPSVATTVTLSAGQVGFVSLGESQKVSASVKDQRGATMANASVTWTSSATSVASVDGGGTVTAVSVGNATVTATSGAATATLSVTVEQVPASLALSQGLVAFTEVGASQTVSATVLDGRSNEISDAVVTWSSSNTTVAEVSASGEVTAEGGGSTVVTASSGSVSATLRATVNLWSPQDAQVVAAYRAPVDPTLDVGYITPWTITDLDGDGNEDLVLSSWAACNEVGCGTGQARNPATPVHIFQRAGDGGLEDATQELLGGELDAWTNEPVVTDLNGDGMPDIFLGGFTDIPPNNAPSKYLLSGGGRYTVHDDPTEVWAHGSSAADLDGDGCQDVLVGNSNAPFWKGDCMGGLTPTTYAEPLINPIVGFDDRDSHLAGSGMGVCPGDFDGDGVMDVLYTDATVALRSQTWTPLAQNNVIFQVNWAGSKPSVAAVHSLPMPVLDRGSQPGDREKSHDMRCQVADLDRDGDLDILVSSTPWPEDNTSWGGSQLQVYMNQGGWVFEDLSDSAFPGRSLNQAFGFKPMLRDVNGDGYPDLVFSGNKDANPYNPIWLGNGDGTFRTSAVVDFQALAEQAGALITQYGNLPDWAVPHRSGEIALLRRATGEFDAVVPVATSDAVARPGAPYGTNTIYVVFIPTGFVF